MKYICTLLLMLVCTSANAQNLTLKASDTEYRQGAYQRNVVRSNGNHVGNSPKVDIKFNPATKVAGTTTGLKVLEVRSPKVTATVNGKVHTAEGEATALSSITGSLVTPALAVGAVYESKLRAPSVNPPDSVICEADQGVGVYTTRKYEVNDSRENIVNMYRGTIQFQATVNTNRVEANTGKVRLVGFMQFKMDRTNLKCYYDRGLQANGVVVGGWIIEGTLSNENGILINYDQQAGTEIIVYGDDINKTFKMQDSFAGGGSIKPELIYHDDDPFNDFAFPGLESDCGSLNLTGVDHQTLDEDATMLNNFRLLGVYPMGGTPPNWP